MKKHLGLLLLFCLLTATALTDEEEPQPLLLSTPEQIATLSSEPSYLIGGLISPLSGQPSLRQTDLIAKGAESVTLTRVYIPPHMPCYFPRQKKQPEEWEKIQLYEHLKQHYRGWQFYPHLRLELFRDKKVRFSDPQGATLEFTAEYSTATLTSPSYAFSNTAGDTPSGNYELRNTRITFENDDTITIHAPDGTVRRYVNANYRTKNSTLFLLVKEILPNGKILRYQYKQLQLQWVQSVDPEERYVYAYIKTAGLPERHHCQFTTSSGVQADYIYTNRLFHAKVKEKHVRRTINYYSPPLLQSVSSPFYREEKLDYCGRHLLQDYFGKESVFHCQHGDFGSGIPHYRVHELRLPVGGEGQNQPVYHLSYQPPIAGEKEGTTTVKSSDGTSTLYHFSPKLLPTKIQYFGQEGTLQKEKRYSWNDKQWLQSIEMADSQNNLLFRRTYEYDPFANPIRETFTADLTGEGYSEDYTIKRAFSQDGRNLLLTEESEEGKILSFSYLPNTNLITTKLTKDSTHILLREFLTYDDANNLTQKITDDGTSEDKNDLTGVTQRQITNYILRQEQPFLHLPAIIEEKYQQEGIEKLLKRTHLHYDKHGNIEREEIYDAEDRFAYTLHKGYNERGDLLWETNPLGQKATYDYHPRGHLKEKTNFSGRLQKNLHYDANGRLREQQERGEEGTLHTTSYHYDFHDRLIQKTDPFQNSTTYTHDPLVNQITKTTFPPIPSFEGQALPVITSSSYDPFGREISKTDANGNTTQFQYNAYGSPTKITHPDGSQEQFRYTKKGLLLNHTDTDGLTIRYQRDILGRVLSKTYISSNETYAQETFIYSGFALLTETDKEGTLKSYTYDGAGRKIREEHSGRTTDFLYDSLGRLSTLRKHNGDNTLILHYQRDLLDRITEESKTDTAGRLLYKITYAYDNDGNRKTITRYINGQEAIETFAYDPFLRLTHYIDAEGYSTHTTYDENFTNILGQRVLRTATTDPRQITTLETQDALAHITEQKILDTAQTLSHQEKFCDSQGNLLTQKDHVYTNGSLQSIQTLQYTYTSRNHVESITRAFGTKDARTTSYSYTPSGKTATKTLPDGIVLTYHYHPLGFLSSLTSSDGHIHHIFTHNKLGHLLSTSDQNTAIQRELDPFGNVTHETFSTGLEIKKQYDDFNRLTTLKMNSAEVHYTYDPLFLRSVARLTPKGEPLYTHEYTNYDLDGNLLSENLLAHLGEVTHATTLRGQKASISSPYFTEQASYDPNGNLTTHNNDGLETSYTYDGLSQLTAEDSLAQSFLYANDSLYNRIQKNNSSFSVNDLNELLSIQGLDSSYDLNGNQTLKKTPQTTYRLTYDPLQRLIEATAEKKKIQFLYDPLGRRLSKIAYDFASYGWKETARENYLYNGQNEIGAFTSGGSAKNLRILGLAKHTNVPASIAIELEGKPFAPILDIQGNIRRLIDLPTQTVAHKYEFTAFGEEITPITDQNPWRYASKRLDPELNLIYFGKRYYDPEFARWLTTDPAGFVDSTNLYQFVYNNPFRYTDPDGQFALLIPFLVWGAEAALPALSAYIIPALYGVMTGALSYAAYKAVEWGGSLDGYNTSSDVLDIYDQRYSISKEQIDERLTNNPEELLRNPDWKETSHPDAKEKGHRVFENTETGEKLRYDEGNPELPGHRGKSHWHRHNPDKGNRRNEYLDAKDNPVPKNSPESHLYPSGGK